jgi:hypothetical protein
MATITQVHKNGARAGGNDPKPDAKPVLLMYPEKTTTTGMIEVTVFPELVNKDKTPTVFFHTNFPGKVRIEFLSPAGNVTDKVADSEPYTLARGGFYHFNCYFTSGEGAEESEPVGGMLDVVPHKP